MKKQVIYSVIFFFGLISCDYFPIKKNQKSSEKVIVKPIDFSTVDAYPLLPECEKLSLRIEQRKCFYSQLSRRIETSLGNFNFSFSKPVKDTIFIKIQVSDQGKMMVSSILISDNLKSETKNLEKEIYNSVISIPKIQPAIKSGIPVTTEFTLPLIIANGLD